jgi:hypothetical protein
MERVGVDHVTDGILYILRQGELGFLYTDFNSKVTWVERMNSSNVLEMKVINDV